MIGGISRSWGENFGVAAAKDKGCFPELGFILALAISSGP